MSICDCCGDGFKDGESFSLVGDECVCETCLEKDGFVCGYCEDVALHIDGEKIHSRDYGEICEDCYTNEFYMCESCDNIIHFDDSYIGDGNRFCEDCFNESYRICSDCGESVHRDGSLYRGERYYCAGCWTSRDVPEVASMRIEWSGNKPSPTTKKRFGIELECYNTKEAGYPTLINNCGTSSEFFKAVGDCSVNGKSNGVEYVSIDLPNNKEGYKIVEQFCKGLKKAGHTIDRKAGFHAHIGVCYGKELTLESLQKMMIGYVKMEKLFFKMMPKSRQLNPFSLPMSKDISIKDILLQKKALDLAGYYYEKSFKNWSHDTMNSKYVDKRYYYANFHSLFYRGTLELRLHSGTLNPKKVINWVKIHRCFIDWLMDNNTTIDIVKAINDKKFMTIIGKDLAEYVVERISKMGRGEADNYSHYLQEIYGG